MTTKSGMELRELNADELDQVGGAIWQAVGAFIAGYLMEKALDATPVGTAAQKLFEPSKLVQGYTR